MVDGGSDWGMSSDSGFDCWPCRRQYVSYLGWFE